MAIRFGVAGLGIHGERYANHLLAGDVEGATLAAVSRRDEAAGKAFAERHGVEFFPDPLTLATAPGVDAVAVVLPPDLQAPVTAACLTENRPVLVEKPLAADAVTARDLVAKGARSSAPAMVAQTLRFDPLVCRMRQEAGELGPVRMVAVSQRFEPFHRDWIDDPVRGGILLNTGVHSFDLLRFLTGAEPVSLTAEVRRTHTVHTEDQFVATVVLEPGAILATVDNGRVTRGRSGRIEIVCDGGQLVGDHVHRQLVRIRGREREALGLVAPEPTVRAALRAFVEAMRTGTEPPITLRDGLAAVALADAAQRSATDGRRVHLAGSY